jgi:ribosomal 50S subunit-recycling heat shock protein
MILCSAQRGLITKNNKERVTPMRLDKYLKVSRIIKRRTVANEAADAGRVSFQ